MATTKAYTIEITRYNYKGEATTRTTTGTLEELKEYFSYKLLCGSEASRKIPRNPKTIKSLVNALNASADVCGTQFSYDLKN